jgi:cell division topological specificity factor
MSLFERIFGKQKNSAHIAKDRLKIMLAHERADCSLPYLNDLRNDLIEVIKKYTKVEDVKIRSEKNQNIDLLEVEITLSK